MIADLFIKRPKFAIVIAILMMLAGGICLNQLPIAEYPEIAPTSINVQATYTGASAQVVMETLASPIEEELNGLENLLYFSSKSDNTGGYSLSLTFKSGTNSDINMVNVQNALKRVEYKLPKEVTDQGIKIKKRSSDILGFFAFRSTSMSSLELNNFVKTRVKDEVARVPGISAVNLMPEKNYSMRIWLDALRMSALNITPDDVSNAIKAQNVQAAAGSIGSEGENNFIQYKVNVTGRLQTVEEFSKIIVRTGQDGHVTRLDDIARIELGAETYTGSSRKAYPNNKVIWQGVYGQYRAGYNNFNTGTLWFDEASAALAGKTVHQATLSLRRSNGGSSAARNVYLGAVALRQAEWATTYRPAFTAPTGLPAYPAGQLSRECEGVYEPCAAYSGSYSPHYTMFYGLGSDFVPVLTVTYS